MPQNPEFRVRSVHDDEGVRLHILRQGEDAEVDWVATLSPMPEGSLAEALSRILAPGWEASMLSPKMPRWDRINGVIHVGAELEREGYYLNVARMLRPGAEVPDIERADIIDHARQEIAASDPDSWPVDSL